MPAGFEDRESLAGRSGQDEGRSDAIAYQRPYDLRHSFASLLLHEARSVIYVAPQLGHGAALTMSTYGHVIDELEDAPNQDAETAIRAARFPAFPKR